MISRAVSHALLALALVVSFASADRAEAYSSVFVFGDSLSDAGAFNSLGPTNCPPSPPYDNCRFSNGPTWAELVANAYGTTADEAYAGTGGTNYAIGGARSDEIAGFQVNTFSADVAGMADPNALYIVWGGGNDFLQSIPPATTGNDAVTAATNIVSAVSALATLGATDFIVPNIPVPDLTYALTFAGTLSAGLAGLPAGLNIVEFDVLSLNGAIITDPLVAASFGFTNVADPCFDSSVPSVCANPNEYLLWDPVHPTARGHEVIAGAALALIPEPGTGLLLGMGLGLLGRSTRARLHAA